MFRPAPRASGYFRTDYGQDLALVQTRAERISLAVFLLILTPRPFVRHCVPFDILGEQLGECRLALMRALYLAGCDGAHSSAPE